MNKKALETELEIYDYFPIVDALSSDYKAWFFIKMQTIFALWFSKSAKKSTVNNQ